MPGTRFGPDRIRACSETVEAYSPYFQKDLTGISIYDTGNIELEGVYDMESKLESIKKVTRGWMGDGARPLLIGGEHTLTYGAVRAAREIHPDLAVLQLDAHADMRDMGETGSRFSHDTVMRRVSEVIKSNSLIQVGIRSFIKEEDEAPGVHRFRIDEIDSIRKRLEGGVTGRGIWLTFDLDVLDPAIMPAVGTPEPNGASYQQVIDLLLALKGLNFVGADLVEFNPLAADFIAPCVTAANLVRELCCLFYPT
jgi:agmatinase